MRSKKHVQKTKELPKPYGYNNRREIDAALEVMAVVLKRLKWPRGASVPHRLIAEVAGCHASLIQQVEQHALKTLRHRMRVGLGRSFGQMAVTTHRMI